VTLDAERLVVRPAERLTDEIRGAIRAHRTEIIRRLEAEWIEAVRLLRQCGVAYGFTEQEHAEAFTRALADRDSATRCFRTIWGSCRTCRKAAQRRKTDSKQMGAAELGDTGKTTMRGCAASHLLGSGT